MSLETTESPDSPGSALADTIRSQGTSVSYSRCDCCPAKGNLPIRVRGKLSKEPRCPAYKSGELCFYELNPAVRMPDFATPEGIAQATVDYGGALHTILFGAISKRQATGQSLEPLAKDLLRAAKFMKDIQGSLSMAKAAKREEQMPFTFDQCCLAVADEIRALGGEKPLPDGGKLVYVPAQTAIVTLESQPRIGVTP